MSKQLSANKELLVFVLVLLSVGAGAFVVYHIDQNEFAPYSKMTTMPIEGIQCQSSEFDDIHNHAHLDIFVNGKQFPIPANVGIVGKKCFYWLHTHDNSGIIHIESPDIRVFTLNQFFKIWNGTVSNLPGNMPDKIIINGNSVTTDLNLIPLNQHDEIVLIYGTSPADIPKSFDFGPNY